MSEPAETCNFVRHRSDVWHVYGELNSPTIASLYQVAFTANPNAHNVLLIASPGGYLEDTLGLYFHLVSRLTCLETRVVGETCSAAVILLQAGRLRTAVDGCCLMTHGTSVDTSGDVAAAASCAKAANYAHERALEILAARTGTPKKTWRRRLRTERYLTTDAARDWNLLDEILVP